MNATQKPRNRYKAMFEAAVADREAMRRQMIKLGNDATYNFWFGVACGVGFCVGLLLVGSFL